MKANNRILAVITLAAIFFWCLGCTFYSITYSLSNSVSIRWEEAGVSPATLVRQQKYAQEDNTKEQPQVTLWQEEFSQEISDSGERSLSASVIFVFGNCEDVTTVSLISGVFPSRSDTKGCAVSSELAFSLWGSTNVIGMPMEIGTERLFVRGVFEDNECRVFRQIDKDSDSPVSNMQLTFNDGGCREEAERFLASADFPSGNILDLSLLNWFCKAIMSLPLVFLALGMLLRLVKRGLNICHYPLLFTSFLLLSLLVITGLIMALGKAEIPARLIPTRWSDFDSWQSLFSGYLNNLITWLSFTPTSRDMELWSSIVPLLFLSLITAILVMAAAIKVKVRSYRSLNIYCAAYMLTLSIVTCIVSSFGLVGFHMPMYLMPCLWLLLDLLLWWYEGWLRCL